MGNRLLSFARKRVSDGPALKRLAELPDELLQDVFIFLRLERQMHYRRVCRKWLRLLGSKYVTTTVTSHVTHRLNRKLIDPALSEQFLKSLADVRTLICVGDDTLPSRKTQSCRVLSSDLLRFLSYHYTDPTGRLTIHLILVKVFARIFNVAQLSKSGSLVQITLKNVFVSWEYLSGITTWKLIADERLTKYTKYLERKVSRLLLVVKFHTSLGGLDGPASYRIIRQLIVNYLAPPSAAKIRQLQWHFKHLDKGVLHATGAFNC